MSIHNALATAVNSGTSVSNPVRVYTADQWPGPPAVLPPLMTDEQRLLSYDCAGDSYATVEDLAAVYADIGQRLAIALHSAPPLAQDEECDE